MIESFSQTGQRRKMISSESSVQPEACRSDATDTGTKRIVTSHGFCFLLRSAKTLAGSGTRLLKKIQLKENITSCCQPQSRSPAYWPVISANALIEQRFEPTSGHSSPATPQGPGSVLLQYHLPFGRNPSHPTPRTARPRSPTCPAPHKPEAGAASLQVFVSPTSATPPAASVSVTDTEQSHTPPCTPSPPPAYPATSARSFAQPRASPS